MTELVYACKGERLMHRSLVTVDQLDAMRFACRQAEAFGCLGGGLGDGSGIGLAGGVTIAALRSATPVPSEPSADDISREAFLRYERSGRVPGRSEENWAAARASLEDERGGVL